jgi:hypothetical protein
MMKKKKRRRRGIRAGWFRCKVTYLYSGSVGLNIGRVPVYPD